MERVGVLVLSVIFLLGGCAAALVPETSDPKKNGVKFI